MLCPTYQVQLAGLTPCVAAWENLQNDDALEQGLEDLNAGQSHRARLLTLVPQVQAASSAADDVEGRSRGGFNPRGTGRGGRGGSIIGSRPVRTARKRFVWLTFPLLAR